MAAPRDRRDAQRDKLIDCAATAIAAGGLAALKARDLAACVDCSVGAIYNLVSDLDELVLRVNRRTLSDLDATLEAVTAVDGDVGSQLIAWARAYAAFAATHHNAWRVLFEFRMANRDSALPDWFATDRERVFDRLERVLAPFMGDAGVARRRARTLFSAVHGIVALGLEQKLVEMPATELDGELEAFIEIFVRGAKLHTQKI